MAETFPHAGAPDVRLRALRPLIGRDAEMAAIRARLTEARLVTLTGPGGVGKTRLAQEVAAEHGGTFVDLSAIRDRALVAPETAAALGAEADPGVPAETRIAAAIDPTDGLLILDNLEQIIAASGAIGAILVAAPTARIVATSRVALGLPGEVVLPIAPLGLPTSDRPDDVAASPAGSLFLWLARARGEPDRLDPEEAIAIAALCRRLDGLPLALELAAARLALFSPAAILRRLDVGPRSLLSKPDPGRHASLAAVLDWSLDLLLEEHRRVLFVVSICPAGFDLALAEWLVPEADVLVALDELVRHALLRVIRQADGEPRFTMLETIRSAARAHLTPDDAARAQQRLAEQVSALVEQFGTKMLVPGTSDVARLDPERDNIRAVLDWAVSNDPELGLEIAARCRDHWVARGDFTEGIQRLVTLLEANSASSPGRARGLATLAQFQLESAGFQEGGQTAERALAAAISSGDLVAEARARSLIRLLDPAGRAAQGHLQRMQAIAVEVGDPTLTLRVNRDLAQGAVDAGDIDEAVVAFETVAEQARQLRYPAVEALALATLSELHLAADRPRQGLAYAARATDLYRQAGVTPNVAMCLGVAAVAHARLGATPEALAALREMMGTIGDLRLSYFGVDALVYAVAVFVSLGDVELACRALGAARGGKEARGEPWMPVELRSIDIDLTRAKRLLGPVRVELAILRGREAGAEAVLLEVEAGLERDQPSQPGPRIRLQHGELTEREVEVLRLLADGRSDAEIADALFISRKTASVHVSNIKSKLGAATRLEVALRAREMGFGD